MKLTGTTAAGVPIDLGLPLQIKINRASDAPADDLTVVLVRSGELPPLRSVKVTEGERLLFWGWVDEQTEQVTQSGATHTLVARSRAALLLDSQAIPQTYQSPPFSVVFARHAQPYGISAFRVPVGGGYIGELVVRSGMSDWQVLAECCERMWHTNPRITPEGLLLVEPQTAEQAVFCNTGAGVPYLSIEKRRKPYVLLGEVLVQSPKDGKYTPVARDIEAQRLGLIRRRCLSAASSQNPEAVLRTARQNEWEITLVCPGWPPLLPGMLASVNDWGIEGMKVWELRQVWDSGGQRTVVTLRRAVG